MIPSIKEDGCDKRAHQSYLGAERITPVIPNWFQPCQCCCCLCYPGEYLRLGTFISYNWAQVLEARDCHFDLCVDATETATSFKYLGSVIADEGSMDPHSIMDPHSRAPKKNTSHGNEVLPQDTTHLIQRPCYQRGSSCQDPAGNRTT